MIHEKKKGAALAAAIAAALAAGVGAAWFAGSEVAVRADAYKATALFKEKRYFAATSEAAMAAGAVEHYSKILKAGAKKGKLDASAREVELVRAVADPLIATAKKMYPATAAWKWEVHLMDDPNPNAFCMPGGKILVQSGIVELLGRDKDKLAAVLGHEIAHALMQHSRQRTTETLAVASLLWTSGKSVKFGALRQNSATSTASDAVLMRHNREHESEADVAGLELLARAGFDPAAAPKVWADMGSVEDAAEEVAKEKGQSKSLGKGDAAAAYARSHPLNKERLETLAALVPRAMEIRGKEAGSWLVNASKFPDSQLELLDKAEKAFGVLSIHYQVAVVPVAKIAAQESGEPLEKVLALVHELSYEAMSIPGSALESAYSRLGGAVGSWADAARIGEAWGPWVQSAGLRPETRLSLLNPKALKEVCAAAFAKAPKDEEICVKGALAIAEIMDDADTVNDAQALLMELLARGRPQYAALGQMAKERKTRSASEIDKKTLKGLFGGSAPKGSSSAAQSPATPEQGE